MSIRQHRELLDESQLPTSWYNIIPDLPDFVPDPIHASGRMVDSGLPDQDLSSALAAIPVLAG